MLCEGFRVRDKKQISSSLRDQLAVTLTRSIPQIPSSGLEFAAHSRGAESVAREVAAGLVAPPQIAPEQISRLRAEQP